MQGEVEKIVHATEVIRRILVAGFKVEAHLDLQPLSSVHLESSPARIANGVVLDRRNACLWVSGKYWDKIYLLAVDLPQALKKQAGLDLNCLL